MKATTSILIGALVCAPCLALAQSTAFYGSDGSYRGTAYTNSFGGMTTTNVYSSTGGYQGRIQSNSFGGMTTTNVYGGDGSLLGRSTTFGGIKPYGR